MILTCKMLNAVEKVGFCFSSFHNPKILGHPVKQFVKGTQKGSMTISTFH